MGEVKAQTTAGAVILTDHLGKELEVSFDDNTIKVDLIDPHAMRHGVALRMELLRSQAHLLQRWLASVLPPEPSE